MLGSVGVTFWYCGAGPRFAGTSVAMIVRGPSHPNPPNAVFTITFFTFVAFAVAVSTIHSSTPAGVTLPAAMYFPSGDQLTSTICAPAGNATGISLPSAMFLIFIPTEYG